MAIELGELRENALLSPTLSSSGGGEPLIHSSNALVTKETFQTAVSKAA